MLLTRFKQLFRKKESFALEGVRDYLRFDDELATIDKKAADAAFVACYQEIAVPFMKSRGFVRWPQWGFARLNSLDVLEYVRLQKERSGSKTFTVNVGVMPLYVSQHNRSIEFRMRLGELVRGRDAWWDYADETIARVSFSNVTRAIERYAFPWFETYRDEAAIKAQLTRKVAGNAEWLRVIDNHRDALQIMQDNVAELRLPKSLLADRRP